MKTLTEVKKISMPQKQSLIEVKDYTKEFLDSKKPESQILTSYFVENDKLTEQMQDITKRTDLKFCDFVAFAIQNTYGLGAEPKHIGRKWNLRANIELRLGLNAPLMAQTKPLSIVPLKPLKPLANDGLRLPNAPLSVEFKAPNDDFNKFIMSEIENGKLNESQIIDALKLQSYTEDQLRPYFKSLN